MKHQPQTRTPSEDSPASSPAAAPRRRTTLDLWLIALPIVGVVATMLASQADEPLKNWVALHSASIWKWFGFCLLVSGVLIGLQGMRSMPNGDRLLIGFLAPVLFSTAIVHLLKALVGRARPFMNDGTSAFIPLAMRGEFESFPSGHTQYAFAVATIWFLHWPKLRWIALPWAIFVAFERILTGKHFLTDVIVGATIGAFCTLLFTRILGERFYRMTPLNEKAGD